MTNPSEEHNQRTIRAIILCVLVAVVYTQVFLAPKRRPAPLPQPAASATAVVPINSQITPPTGAPAQIVGNAPSISTHPKKAEIEASAKTYIESSKVRVGVAHLGARFVNFQLKDYKLHLGEDAVLDMVDNPDGTSLPLGIYAGSESDDFVTYTLTSVNGAAPSSPNGMYQIAPGAEVSLEFTGQLPSGRTIRKQIKFRDDSYLFEVNVALDRPIDGAQTTWLEWSHYFPTLQDNPRLKLTHITYLDGFGKIRHVALTDLLEGLRDFGTSQWASLGDIYFMATIVPTVAGKNTLLGHEGDMYVGRVAGTNTGGAFKVYVGPKDYKTLSAVGDSLDRAIDLGWFSFLALPLLWLLHYLYLFLNNYGLAIISLTLIVKTALLPLSKAGFQSMKKMSDLQPEMKALRERIKDPNQLNQEVLALYQRKGVNPMGGCLPMFIQIPVFLGLYQALLNSIELRHAPFALWIHDLSAPERLEMFGIGIPVMVLLMAASMIAQQWTTPMPSADPVQRKMMMMMPVVFAIMFIVFPMPAGLVLYWLVNNIISITQQVYMRNAEKGSVYTATVFASAGIFAVGFILTQI